MGSDKAEVFCTNNPFYDLLTSAFKSVHFSECLTYPACRQNRLPLQKPCGRKQQVFTARSFGSAEVGA